MDALLERQYEYYVLIKRNEKVLYKLLPRASHLVIWMQSELLRLRSNVFSDLRSPREPSAQTSALGFYR